MPNAAILTVPSFVFRRREAGKLLPVQEMLDRTPVEGIVYFGSYRLGTPDARCWLFDPADSRSRTWGYIGQPPRELIVGMAHAWVAREDGLTRLYRGVEDDGLQRPQAWLCTPSIERGRQILAALMPR